MLAIPWKNSQQIKDMRESKVPPYGARQQEGEERDSASRIKCFLSPMAGMLTTVSGAMPDRGNTPSSLPRAAPAVQAARPLPPVLSVRCGASRRPAGGIQRWPAAGVGRAGRPQARASAGRVVAGWQGVGGRSRWKRPFDFPAPLRCQLTVSTKTSGGGTMVIEASSP